MRYLVVGVSDTVDQKANTDSEEAGSLVADWVKVQEACNKEVVVWLGSHLPLVLEEVPLAAAVGQPVEVEQELTAGCVCRMHYQHFCQWQQAKIFPHWTENGLAKMILSGQVEAWLILSECQLALACLSESVQTGGPTQAA